MQKPHEKIALNFKNFLLKEGQNAYIKLKDFFKEQKDLFYNDKIFQFEKEGLSHEQAVIKTRQGWVSVIGRSLELVVEILIDDFCKKYNLKITNDKKLRSKKLNDELDAVKRTILVHFDEYSVLPDGDIIIYKLEQKVVKILAILSVKNSFRERYTETPYWKLKFLESSATRHIKVFMITPDNDNEISFKSKLKKSRIVMEYELDGIYLAKSDFDGTSKVKGIEELVLDLRKLL